MDIVASVSRNGFDVLYARWVCGGVEIWWVVAVYTQEAAWGDSGVPGAPYIEETIDSALTTPRCSWRFAGHWRDGS